MVVMHVLSTLLVHCFVVVIVVGVCYVNVYLFNCGKGFSMLIRSHISQTKALSLLFSIVLITLCINAHGKVSVNFNLRFQEIRQNEP